ncbi:hypothetical protein O6H91_16G015300 [Diphasiastrum complanatum]|uniref:Uncharacterized protein n=1 Tax=Diphasiastrum complanatum TaxID=34168 RepID=A0ACC2BA52_DIPCM|nr:hypothetical protein O6H91_16G015300 [Diphasiastrum complanatum]
MLLYLRDGRSLYARRNLKSGDKLHLQNLLPIQSDSVQMSGPNLGVEAIWDLNDALDASELAFDINVTLYTSVIRQIPFWSCSCTWRAPTSTTRRTLIGILCTTSTIERR